MPKLFVDMDGVLADFDAHHEAVFGVRASKLLDNVDWKKVRAADAFYLNIPPMSDMEDLWAHVLPYSPTILTGVPLSVAEAPGEKKAWVAKNLGPDVPVICCPSKDKSLHCNPGDILIDDWEKYQLLWIARGGFWVTHYNAGHTIKQLCRLGVR